eukprot:1178215-Prorocentrum_minimum.AAC.3
MTTLPRPGSSVRVYLAGLNDVDVAPGGVALRGVRRRLDERLRQLAVGGLGQVECVVPGEALRIEPSVGAESGVQLVPLLLAEGAD